MSLEDPLDVSANFITCDDNKSRGKPRFLDSFSLHPHLLLFSTFHFFDAQDFKIWDMTEASCHLEALKLEHGSESYRQLVKAE